MIILTLEAQKYGLRGRKANSKKECCTEFSRRTPKLTQKSSALTQSRAYATPSKQRQTFLDSQLGLRKPCEFHDCVDRSNCGHPCCMEGVPFSPSVANSQKPNDHSNQSFGASDDKTNIGLYHGLSDCCTNSILN